MEPIEEPTLRHISHDGLEYLKEVTEEFSMDSNSPSPVRPWDTSGQGELSQEQLCDVRTLRQAYNVQRQLSPLRFQDVAHFNCRDDFSFVQWMQNTSLVVIGTPEKESIIAEKECTKEILQSPHEEAIQQGWWQICWILCHAMCNKIQQN